jgi:hypothetical protein
MLESLVIGLTSVKMEIDKTRDRKKTSLEGEYGRHSWWVIILIVLVIVVIIWLFQRR